MFTTAHFHVIHAARAFYFLERYLQVEPYATLGGATRGVVLDAITLVHLHLAVVLHHWNRHDHLLLRLSQHLVQARLQVEELRGLVESRHHGLERILLVEKPILVGAN
jgi:hypothetical protein